MNVLCLFGFLKGNHNLNELINFSYKIEARCALSLALNTTMNGEGILNLK